MGINNGITFNSIIPRYKCAECGREFVLHSECRVRDYAFKLPKKGKGGEHYWMLCKWSCYKKFKTKKAQERMKSRKGGLAGHTIEETENWLRWAGEDVPETEEKVSCREMVEEKYYHIYSLYMDGKAWPVIRSKTGLTGWSWEAVRSNFLKIMKERGRGA